MVGGRVTSLRLPHRSGGGRAPAQSPAAWHGAQLEVAEAQAAEVQGVPTPALLEGGGRGRGGGRGGTGEKIEWTE